MQLAPAAGGFGLGQLVGSLYEKEAQKEGPSPSCYGPHCFRYKPFATTSTYLLLALLQSWLLSLLALCLVHLATASFRHVATWKCTSATRLCLLGILCKTKQTEQHTEEQATCFDLLLVHTR
jgi:hypothetical protein